MKKDIQIILAYQGKQYTFLMDFSDDDPEWSAQQAAEWMFNEGNYACDCNRSLFINEYCDKDFPDMDCGDTIELIEPRYKDYFINPQ